MNTPTITSSHDLYIGMQADLEASDRYMKLANSAMLNNLESRKQRELNIRQSLESRNVANLKQMELQRRGEFCERCKSLKPAGQSCGCFDNGGQ